MAAPPLAKYLASTEKKTRDKAIKNLSVFLSQDAAHDAIAGPEMAKLWKGIFYCFWMSDKPLVQQALATELAELVLTITSTPGSLAFLRGFWEATVREWNGIDRLRLDKYYMLVRRFVNATFRLLLRTDWEKSACEEYTDILTRSGGPLCPDDQRVPTSLAFHLADIYLEELDKVLTAANTDSSSTLPHSKSKSAQAEEPTQSSPAPISTLLSAFLTLAARTPNSITYKRLESALFTPILAALSPLPLEGDFESTGPRPSKRQKVIARAAAANPTASNPHAQVPYVHLPMPRLAPHEQLLPGIVDNACATESTEGRLDRKDIRAQLLRRIFEVASEEGTRDSNRRKMYKLWKGERDEDESEDDE